jgi:hypothetical protein
MTEPSDPFDQLAPAGGHTVAPIFAARLRARIERALVSAPERTMIDLPNRATPGAVGTADTNRSNTMTQAITPYVCVHDASAALD